MSNQNIGTPRFYIDYINYQLSRGKTQNGNFDVLSGTNMISTFTKGGETELFDMKPLNLNEWDTTVDSGNDHVLMNFNLGDSNLRTGFIAILNHNLNSCNGKIRFGSSSIAARVQIVDMPLADTIASTEVVNADTISGEFVTPATDGSTIIRFSESTNRYWGLQFEGDSSFDGTTKLTVGNVLIGEYYEMPHSPDLAVVRSIIFENEIQESIGGQRYSNMASYGRSASSTSKSPFLTTTAAQNVFGGRQKFDMTFSYLNSSDVMPDEYHIYQPTDDSFVGDVWNRANGSHIPFIFSIDKDSEGADAESEHIFARFDSELKMTQVAHNFWNVSMSIAEEF